MGLSYQAGDEQIYLYILHKGHLHKIFVFIKNPMISRKCSYPLCVHKFTYKMKKCKSKIP